MNEMVPLPGGTFLMGSDHCGEGPIREVAVDPFEIDVFPVTNAAFEAFVKDTRYQTEAERFGWSFVFWSHVRKELVEDTVAGAPWWCKVASATWREPEGPGSDIAARANYPVVHVSANDAAAFAAWAGKQLPSEAQWEYAARGGLEQKLYPWGDDLTPGGKHMCNIWQGDFPNTDTGEDGYTGTCPVDAFPANGYGLYSMTGNAWEWCEGSIMKGGSFLCHASYCNRYRVAARTTNEPDSSASNVGFRCVRAASIY